MTPKQAYGFGLIDGLNGAVGLVIGLMRLGAPAAVILVALLSRAGSSAVSMMGAEYASDTAGGSRLLKAKRVGGMGLGYLTSALLPGLGFALDVHVGLAIFIPATVVILVVIVSFRATMAGWPQAILSTLIVFVLAVAAGLLASLAG